MKKTGNQMEISHFSDEEEGKNYVICLASYYLYFLDEKGKMLAYQHLSELYISENCFFSDLQIF